MPASGFDRINKIFDGTLESVIGEMKDSLWARVA
jgi:hypothetical protein